MAKLWSLVVIWSQRSMARSTPLRRKSFEKREEQRKERRLGMFSGALLPALWRHRAAPARPGWGPPAWPVAPFQGAAPPIWTPCAWPWRIKSDLGMGGDMGYQIIYSSTLDMIQSNWQTNRWIRLELECWCCSC